LLRLGLNGLNATTCPVILAREGATVAVVDGETLGMGHRGGAAFTIGR